MTRKLISTTNLIKYKLKEKKNRQYHYRQFKNQNPINFRLKFKKIQ